MVEAYGLPSQPPAQAHGRAVLYVTVQPGKVIPHRFHMPMGVDPLRAVAEVMTRLPRRRRRHRVPYVIARLRWRWPLARDARTVLFEALDAPGSPFALEAWWPTQTGGWFVTVFVREEGEWVCRAAADVPPGPVPRGRRRLVWGDPTAPGYRLGGAAW